MTGSRNIDILRFPLEIRQEIYRYCLGTQYRLRYMDLFNFLMGNDRMVPPPLAMCDKALRGEMLKPFLQANTIDLDEYNQLRFAALQKAVDAKELNCNILRNIQTVSISIRHPYNAAKLFKSAGMVFVPWQLELLPGFVNLEKLILVCPLMDLGRPTSRPDRRDCNVRLEDQAIRFMRHLRVCRKLRFIRIQPPMTPENEFFDEAPSWRLHVVKHFWQLLQQSLKDASDKASCMTGLEVVAELTNG